MTIDEPTLQFWEEHAFYESGLSAHGCFEDLDEYAKKAIHKYGRILLKLQQEHYGDIIETTKRTLWRM